jgi:hypothetical protein
MSVIEFARDHVPVHMRRHIAEAGKVDFVWLQCISQSALDCQYNAHAVRLVSWREIGHFLDVRVPDYTAESGIVRVGDQHDAAMVVAPQHFTAVLRAQLACRTATGRGLGIAHALALPTCAIVLQQHPLNAAPIGFRNIVGHPVIAEQFARDFDHDVIGGSGGVIVIACESLQA